MQLLDPKLYGAQQYVQPQPELAGPITDENTITAEVPPYWDLEERAKKLQAQSYATGMDQGTQDASQREPWNLAGKGLDLARGYMTSGLAPGMTALDTLSKSGPAIEQGMMGAMLGDRGMQAAGVGGPAPRVSKPTPRLVKSPFTPPGSDVANRQEDQYNKMGDQDFWETRASDPNTPLDVRQYLRGMIENKKNPPRVQATVNGKTYDYTSPATNPSVAAGGGQGGAPSVGGSALGQSYRPLNGGGTVSMMQENPNLSDGYSLEQQSLARQVMTNHLRQQLMNSTMTPERAAVIKSLERPETEAQSYFGPALEVAKRKQQEIMSLQQAADASRMTPEEYASKLERINQKWAPFESRLDAYKRANQGFGF